MIKRHHSMPVEELLEQLKPAIAATAAKFDLNVQWTGLSCEIPGPVLGYLKIGKTTLILAASLGFTALLHKKRIESEIVKVLDSIVG